ncbi:hypothetical protein NP233_g4437 [Leucocoprinus birnbaumii]|uniref:RraA-like protein n=1 Tax=Leucocoprinus birnbaumii TaxID=56174 RepID=A0AAD5YRV3_9AGAR|nr:hypothetical protein NP233_g4437 [Leucocoprinus birnbaumii]
MANTQSISAADSSSESDTSSCTNPHDATAEPEPTSVPEAETPHEAENPMRLHLEAWVKRWQFHDALTRWAIWALNIPNQLPGYVMNNIFVVELALNKNPTHSENLFTCGPVPVVQTRCELARCFYRHEIGKGEIDWCVHGQWDDDKVQVCVIYNAIVVHHEGIYHPNAPELNPDGGLIHIAPKLHKAFYETLSMFYRPHLLSALEMNDPSLVDQYVEITMHRTYGLWSYRIIQTPESHRCQRQGQRQGERYKEEVLVENADALGDRMLRSTMMPFKLGESTQYIRDTLQSKFPAPMHISRIGYNTEKQQPVSEIRCLILILPTIMPSKDRQTRIVHPGDVQDYFNPNIHHCRQCAVRWRAVNGTAASPNKERDLSEGDVRRYLNHWIDLWDWHDALTRWAVWASDVPNSPPDVLQVHVLLIELVQRKDFKPPFQVFTGTAVRVIHRDQLATFFLEHGMPEKEIDWCRYEHWGKDDVQVCVVYRNTVVHFEGKHEPGGLEPIGSGLPLRVVPSAQQPFYHALTRTWYIYFMGAIADNDPTLTDNYIERMMYDTAHLFPVEIVMTTEQKQHLEEKIQHVAETKKQKRKRKKESQKKRKRAREDCEGRFSPEAEPELEVVWKADLNEGEEPTKVADLVELGDYQILDPDQYKAPLPAEQVAALVAEDPPKDVSGSILSPEAVPALLQEMQIDFSKIVQYPRALIQDLHDHTMSTSTARTTSKLIDFSTCEISDALIKLKLPHGGYIPDINMYSPSTSGSGLRICGPAYTVKLVSGSDNTSPKLSSHFVDTTPEGSVIVIGAPPGRVTSNAIESNKVKNAVWGGLMTAGAIARAAKGVVISGRCRDLSEHRAQNFPVFARGHSTLGQSPFTRPSEINVPLTIKSLTNGFGLNEANGFPSLTVQPGDWVVGDEDGVVCVPRDLEDKVLELATKGREVDALCMIDIQAGKGVQASFKLHRGK